MRIKTSVSLSSEVLDQVSRYVAGGERSDFVEKAIWNYLEFLKRHRRNRHDLQRINAVSDFLNREAEDVLGYQVPI